MEYIPDNWTDSEGKTHKLKFEGKVIEDLPKGPDGEVLGASFVSQYLGLECRLIRKEYEKDAEGTTVHKPNTGVVLRFKGGHLTIKNKVLLKLFMDGAGFKNGKARMNLEDPGGVWRAMGYVTEKIIQIPVADTAIKPTFKDLDFKKIKIPEEGFNKLQQV